MSILEVTHFNILPSERQGGTSSPQMNQGASVPLGLVNYFFALPLPPDVREAVADFAYFWRTYTGTEDAARWHEAQDYHVTLKFLGDIPAAEALRLAAAAEAVTTRHRPLELALTTPSAFPNIFRPRVLYLGVKSTPALRDLVADLEETLEALGTARDSRPYAPHVTLARVRTSAEAAGKNWRLMHEQAFVKWQADVVALMQTLPPELRTNGAAARYNSIQRFPLTAVEQ